MGMQLDESRKQGCITQIDDPACMVHFIQWRRINPADLAIDNQNRGFALERVSIVESICTHENRVFLQLCCLTFRVSRRARNQREQQGKCLKFV